RTRSVGSRVPVQPCRSGEDSTPLRRSSRAGSAHTVAQQPARSGTGGLAVDEGDFPVDDRVAVALGSPDPPPFAAGQVFGDLFLEQGEVVVVVDQDVGRSALDEDAAVAEAGGTGRQGGEPPVCFLQGEELPLAYEL